MIISGDAVSPEMRERIEAFGDGAIVASPTPGRVRWTRPFVEFLERNGVLRGRYELIDGDILSKMGQNSPHNVSIMRLIAYLFGTQRFAPDTLRSQATMEVRQEDRIVNRPEPDVMVLRQATLTGAPDGSNVLLLVEVSDTTQSDDYGRKAGLYARAGVAEYWVLDVPERKLTVYRDADSETGVWQDSSTYEDGQSVASLCAPESPVSIADILPPPAN